ncbi:MAG: hypothetical protein ACR2QR_03430 [Woeseiaceae bacterium]
MSSGAGISDYLQSGYVIEVVIALLLGLALIPLFRRGLRVDKPAANRWRQFLVYAGWFLTIAAIAIWCLILWIVGVAWIDSVNPSLPKKPSLVFLIIGGMLYFFLVGIAGTAFEASSGTAKSDIMKKFGRTKD